MVGFIKFCAFDKIKLHIHNFTVLCICNSVKYNYSILCGSLCCSPKWRYKIICLLLFVYYKSFMLN